MRILLNKLQQNKSCGVRSSTPQLLLRRCQSIKNMKNQQNINDILAKIEQDWIHEKLFSMQLKIANSQIKAL